MPLKHKDENKTRNALGIETWKGTERARRFKPESEESELGATHGVAAAEAADDDRSGRANHGQDGKGEGKRGPPRVSRRV